MKPERIIDFRYAPSHAQVCIGLVDDPDKTIVRTDGSVNWGYCGKNWVNYYRMYNDEHAVLTADERNRGFTYRVKPVLLHRDELLSSVQDHGKASAAIVTTTEDYKASVLTWKTFAWRTEQDARVDVILWSMTAKDNFITTRSGVSLQSMGHTDGLPVILHTPRVKTVSVSDEPLPFFHAGETMEGAYFIVQEGKMDPADATLDTAKKALAWAENYWDNVTPFVNKFVIPEKQIADMMAACGRNILQAREIKEGVYTYQVGPTEYRGLWMVDGHFILESAHMMGRTEEAFAGVLAVLRRVRPNGGIMVFDHHEKETGIALATLCRQCELTNNDARLEEMWPTLRRALTFIRNQRTESFALGKDYPAYGMFAPTFGDGGINGPEPEYTTPEWVLFGLKYAYETGKRLNLEGYEEFGKEFDDLMHYFRAAVARDHRVTKDGIPYFPQSMVTPEYLEKNGVTRPDLHLNGATYNPQTGTWALAQAIYPGEVFKPDDSIVQELLALLDSVDNTEGIPENTGWEGHNALWGYSAMFYGEAFLYADHPEKAVDYLYAFANHAGPGRTWREEQALHGTQSEEMCGDMPHNWGSAEFIRLTRNLLVMERLGNLELLKGLPEEWLPTEDCALELASTPTRYGQVSIKMTKNENGYHFSFNRSVFAQVPEKLVLHWPDAVEVNGVRTEGTLVLDGDCTAFEAQLYR